MKIKAVQNMKKNDMTSLRKRLIHIMIIGTLLVSQAFSQSYFNALFMDQFGSSHSQDIALGGANTSAYSTVFNTFTNPANQADFKGMNVTGAFSMLTMNENRSYAAIDQFGDRVVDNIYVISRGGQSAFSGGISWGNGNVGMSAATMPFTTPAFFFKEELRGSLYSPNINRDPLIGYHHVEQSGMIQATGLSGAAGFGSWSLGGAMRFLNGIGLESQYGVSVLDSADVSALASETTFLESESWELDNTPILFNIGLIKDLGMHWRVSASFQSGYALESTRQGAIPVFASTQDLPQINWASDTVGLEISIPAQLEVGLRMKPSNPLPTAVYVSLAYQDWENYSVSYSDSLGGELSPFEYPLQETFTIRGGIEHWVSDRVPFRAGMVWRESPIAGELSQSKFSAGSGWVSGPLQFDVAVQLFAVQYSFIDIFVPTSLTPNPTENVRETQTTYSISVSYSL